MLFKIKCQKYDLKAGFCGAGGDEEEFKLWY
jgi:hypothetical protein